MPLLNHTKQPRSFSMFIHHFIVLVEIFYTFWSGYYGNIIIAGFIVSEASNPFRIIKNISDGYEDKKDLGEKAIKTFAVVFLFFRLVLFPVFLIFVSINPIPLIPKMNEIYT